MGNDDVINECQSGSGWWISARLRVALATRCQGNYATQPINEGRKSEHGRCTLEGAVELKCWEHLQAS